MSRQKKPVLRGIDQAKYENALAEYATKSAQESKLLAEMEIKMTAIREQYAPKLKPLQENKVENFDIVQAYCEEHPELFVKKKSYETAFGTLGFRTGTPKLKTLKGFTWGSVLELCKRAMPSYIRTSEEVAKDLLLFDREKVNLAEIGVEVVQEESFFVDLKKEEG
ncbi:MAG: host-nuclease inhibitor Gam family protein [Chitinophagaceae bacterium]